MEEEMQSVISVDHERNVVAAESDSKSINQPLPAKKRAKYGGSTSNSKFKGLVHQQNGHWGAQIYVNHQRIWLGTFKTKTEAAMAYDSAAIKLRSGDSGRNFEWTSITLKEPTFQSFFTNEEVLDMIRHDTYRQKFECFLRACTQQEEVEINLCLVSLGGNEGITCKQLFHKELTPSDVGKLNRLVIPKKFAVKSFPKISGLCHGCDMQLVFYDRHMKMWKFRYCYWSSSQSFVFTRGWSRFVKDKGLRVGDIVAFYECIRGEKANTEASNKYLIIEVSHGHNKEVHDEVKVEEVEEKKLAGDEEAEISNKPITGNADGKKLKLFGVQIM